MYENSGKKQRARKTLVTNKHNTASKKEAYQWWMAPKKDHHYQWWWGYEKVRLVKCSPQIKENYIIRMTKNESII